MRFGSEVIAWNSNVDLLGEKLKTYKRVIGTPMEVSYHHLLATPPSHFTPQKVKG